MRLIAAILAAGLLVPAAQVCAQEPERLLIVLPIFGLVPPEMTLPGPESIVESLLLQLPEKSLRVVAERPAGRVVPEDLESAVRERARELNASGAVWGELMRPGSCRAPRVVRLRILDATSGIILDRDLCPEGTEANALSRAIAVATTHALRSGLVESLKLIDEAGAKILAAEIPRASKCPVCQEPEPCVKPAPCPEPRCPEPVCPEPPRPPWRLAAGLSYSSHPRYQSYALGASLELSWAALDWLEIGLGLQASRGRRIDVTEVHAVYSNWPASLWVRGCLGNQAIQGTLELGFVAAWSRLNALLERFGTSIEVDRFNPGLSIRAGFRWWIHDRVGVHFLLGTTYYLRRQQYTYSYLGIPIEVLSLDSWALTGAVMLVVPFG